MSLGGPAFDLVQLGGFAAGQLLGVLAFQGAFAVFLSIRQKRNRRRG